MIKAPWQFTVALVFVALLSGGVGWWVSQKSSFFDSTNKTEGVKAKKTQEIYRCPMHPHIVSDRPGTCPICHMDLQKVDDDDQDDDEDDEAEDGDDVREQSAKPEGRAGVTLSLERQQLIGVTYAKVKKKNLTREIIATGKVAFDPDLYTAIEEYRQALLSYQMITEETHGLFREQARTLLESAKTKLKLMGFTDEKIRTLVKTKKGGLDFLLPDGEAWIYAEVFEYEAEGLRIGQKLEASLPSQTHRTFKGVISSISPALNTLNRTLRVRAKVQDPNRILRPESFMNVRILIELGERLAVPDEGVLFSHGKAYVFVSEKKGHFQPRFVEVGQKAGNFYEIIRGLHEGETIVNSANFLIDSESKLRSVLEKAVPRKDDARQRGNGGADQETSQGAGQGASHGAHQ